MKKGQHLTKPRFRLLPTETPLYLQHPKYNTHQGWTVMEEAHHPYMEIRFGPPRCVDRWIITVAHRTQRKTIQLSRFILECRLGRVLGPQERSECIDGNLSNHDPLTYRLQTRSLRARHATETQEPAGR